MSAKTLVLTDIMTVLTRSILIFHLENPPILKFTFAKKILWDYWIYLKRHVRP
jgi:hypothetical protein